MRTRLPLATTLRYIISHPMNRGKPIAAVARYVGWQLASRIQPEREFCWVDGARLRVRRGMTGATGNIYCGLHEFVEMAFLLHLLRPGDLFLDVGANVGSYTVLASKVCLAKTLAFEPDADAADSLEQNIRVNGITASAVVHRVALGDHNGKIAFTKGLDTMNRIATGEDGAVQIVPVARLDDICASALPTLVKLDVEGYEEAVLAGAAQVMRSPSLLAVQSELSNSAVTDRLGSFGFTPVFYEPFTREVANRDFGYGISNMLYVRDIARIQKRVSSAPYRVVGGRQL